MKKALVAAAVAGALAAPTAMAADLSINMEWGQALRFGETTTTTAGVDSTVDIQEVADAGRNRLKFNFTETLDNGIGVHAYMVFNTAGTSNAGAVSIRNAFVGFSGEFGSVSIGTNEHFFETDLLTDPLFGDYGATADKIQHINLGQSGFNFTRRDSESVWWTSKDMNGFKLRAAYIMGPASGDGAPTAGADQNGNQIGLSYASGPLFVGVNQATYNDYGLNTAAISSEAAVPIAGSEAKATSLRVDYDLGFAHVQAAIWNMEHQGISVAGTGGTFTSVEASGQGVNIEVPMNGGKAFASMSSIGDQDSTIAGVTSAVVDSGKDSWDVGYIHDMSAQTYMFVRYGSSETGLNFTTTANTTETNELLVGWLLNY